MPLTDARPLHRSCSSWPACGGANGSIRYEAELTHGANAGLKKGVSFLKEFKEQFPLLSWADIIQLASALAIECCGGPTLPMRYGRLDVSAPEQCPKEGNLPDAKPPFGGGARDAPAHLRAIFYRMGFSDREIVALSGAHTLGRAPPRPKRPLGYRPASRGLGPLGGSGGPSCERGAQPQAFSRGKEGREGPQGGPQLWPRHRCRVQGAQALTLTLTLTLALTLILTRRLQGALGRHGAKPCQGRRHAVHKEGRDAAGGRR